MVGNKFLPSFLILMLNLTIGKTQNIPDSVSSLKATQMSSDSVYVKWEKPDSNYTLSHYDIQYAEFLQSCTKCLDAELYLKQIDKDLIQMKIAKLHVRRQYRIYIYSIFKEIASLLSTIDVSLTNIQQYSPLKPDFSYRVSNGGKTVDVLWLPNLQGPGDYFFVSYKKKNDNKYITSKLETEELNIVITDLDKNETYEFFIMAGYGNRTASSDIKEIFTYTFLFQDIY